MKLKQVAKLFIGTVLMSYVIGNSSYCAQWTQGSASKEVAQEKLGSYAKEMCEAANEADLTSAEGAEDLAEKIVQASNELSKEGLGQLERATVARVVDGDTIVVSVEGSGEYTVRLIGVDTPESVASEEYLERTGKENCEEGKEASSFTEEVLSGLDCVYLEADEQDEDVYGRKLRYVWMEEPPEGEACLEEVATKMLNGYLVSTGHASVATYEPNVKYEKLFEGIAALNEAGWEFDQQYE